MRPVRMGVSQQEGKKGRRSLRICLLLSLCGLLVHLLTLLDGLLQGLLVLLPLLILLPLLLLSALLVLLGSGGTGNRDVIGSGIQSQRAGLTVDGRGSVAASDSCTIHRTIDRRCAVATAIIAASAVVATGRIDRRICGNAVSIGRERDWAWLFE